MKRSASVVGVLAAAAALAAGVFQASAQDDEEAPAASVSPRPAEILPNAFKGLLLDVWHKGDSFVAVGDRGHVLLSADGETWTQSGVPVRAALTAVYFADPQNGWAVGHDAAIVATTDGGKTWTLQHFNSGLEKPFLDVYFLDARRGWAVGAYGLFLETADGGNTWTEKDAAAVREEEYHLYGLVPLNNGDLLIVGELGMMGLSQDQGQTWKRLESPYEASLFGAVPRGDKGAIAFGMRGNVFVSDDARGGKWRDVNTGSVASMFGGTALPDNRVALVGLNGVIMVTDGAGVTTLQTPTGTPLSSAVPFKGGLLAVGESGVQAVAFQ